MEYLLTFLDGLIGPVNNMLNVKAGQCLGTTRGALINYAEASLISLTIVLLLGQGGELALGHVLSVPWIFYLGSVFGLLGQVLIITGTPKIGVVLSSTCLMVGSMGISAALDYVFYKSFSLQKVLGICLVIFSISQIKRDHKIKRNPR